MAKPPDDQGAGTTPEVPRDEYEPMVGELLGELDRIAPEGARVLVVSKGDDALTKLASREARHFPADVEGEWLGYHPESDASAIAQLEEERSRGADFIAFPATAFWWLETYPGFASYLDDHFAVAAEHQRRFLVYDLREELVPVGEAPVAPEHEPAAGQPAPEVPPPPLMDRADRLLGYGGHHRTALRPIYEGGEDAFPRFAVRAQGCELTDTAERTFIDWVGGGGPVLLGYRHPAVEDAIRGQLEAGPTLTLMHPLEVEVAELLTEMVTCAEMVTFGKNGSDALTGAIRVARAATGRDLLFQFGVHGFHDWYVSIQPGVRGLPKVLRAFTEPFPYNDLGTLGELFARYPGEVAAIVMEPMAFELPQPGYLEAVIELAHSHGALVIFDEMVTGLRLANGGAQELYGVKPDLACFGKGLANGMPLSALVGARKHMELLPQVAYGMTFRGETLSLAAARAVLEVLRERPVAPHVARIGGQLRRGFDAACQKAGIRARLEGHDSRMALAFENDSGIEAAQAQALFLEECARHGVLTNGSLMPSLAHDGRAVLRTLAAFRAAAQRVAEAVDAGRGALWRAMDAGFAVPGGHGCFEAAYLQGDELLIHGWMLFEDGPPEVIEAAPEGDGAPATAVRHTRSDLVEAFPEVPGAAEAGFSLSLPAREFASGGDYAFTLRARTGEEERFECRAVRRHEEHRALEHRPTCDGGELRL